MLEQVASRNLVVLVERSTYRASPHFFALPVVSSDTISATSTPMLLSMLILSNRRSLNELQKKTIQFHSAKIFLLPFDGAK